MVGRKEHESEINRDHTHLHPYGIRKITGRGFRIGLTRKCGCEL